LRAIALVAPVKPCKRSFSGSELLHGRLQLRICRQLAGRPARSVTLTDVPRAPLACPLKPLDSDAGALFVISHGYLVSGLSEV
jgi:hypothetical protein